MEKTTGMSAIWDPGSGTIADQRIDHGTFLVPEIASKVLPIVFIMGPYTDGNACAGFPNKIFLARYSRLFHHL